jgi:uncharacterized repeat protein (TIGR01451 family)
MMWGSLRQFRGRAALLALTAAGLAVAPAAPLRAQAVAARALITGPVDDARMVRLAGNTRSEANSRNDRGRVPDAMPLEHMLLLLRRPAERESQLRDLIRQLHDRRSPEYHHWLSAAEFGRRFGLAEADVAVITAWLMQHGFTVNGVYPSTLMLDFSGTAGAIRSAFGTEIHQLDAHGVRHIANMSDPQIPAGLAPAVAGIVSLHDFRPHALHVARARTRARARGQYTFTNQGAQYEAVVPADLATIYNFGPLFSAGLSGQGQTIVVIEDTNVYSTADWTTFRSTFGLSGYTSGSFTQTQPSGAGSCSNPKNILPNESEAILDAEWASAAAPNAAIVLASCKDTTTTFGGLIALENLVNGASPPAIVSISYSECEAENGATANATYASTYQQAVAEGTSVFVAAGDEGAASCDADLSNATHGIGVNGFASTPYDVAVGGTDFADAYLNTTATYWSTTNGSTYGSALSYVPEIPWNDSCASSLLALAEGFGASYGSSGFCNSATGLADFLTTASGSGGPSGCASGAASTRGVVSGSCAGTPKPAWQAGVPGIPADGVRDLPDVSLFAANGVWGHYYVFCWSDPSKTAKTDGSAPCTGAPSTWSGAGGTSFASPILAAIQALINQHAGGAQGNPNPAYYTLAASQYASGVNCNSTGAPSGNCVFYDVTLGDMDINCTGASNCYDPSGTYGVLSTSSSAFAPAYGTTTGWDFATGLGSVNAANLVKYWNSSDLALTASGSVTPGGLLSYSLTLGDRGPQTATSVAVTAALPAGFTLVASLSSSFCTQSGQTVSCAVGVVSVGSTVPIMIVVMPGGGGTVSLTFTAGSSNPDLNPADGAATVALNAPGESGQATDGPLPPWSYLLFALALLAIASRRVPARASSRT